MAGLAPGTLRLVPPKPSNDFEDGDILIETRDDDADQPIFDDKGAVVRIEHADGDVTISLDGKPIEDARDEPTEAHWFDNLCDKIDASELSRIADDLLRGIEDDQASRKDWLDARAQGIKLLGLKIEMPGLQGASDGAPVEGMSKVRDPLLLEAVLRFQANARSEMLPTDGPVKIRDDGTGQPASQTQPAPSITGSDFDQNQLADALEDDMNHYLTAVATEYYPDTDRMFFMLGFGGLAFKKVYFCPLRQRPVSETVDANDLIVNDAATDLKNARRVTHRISMRRSTVKRMQILKVYRDVPLHDPAPADQDAVQRAEDETEGVSRSTAKPEDMNREIYECYGELDIKGFEHKLKGKATGLEIPYRVTIDVSTRQILSIVRNYDEDDKELPEARSTFVTYVFVPGFGFYGIGLLHILGNITNAITAAEREMLDNGMFANFPGFLISKQASRQNTSILRIPPGGSQQIDVMGQDIRQSVMPLPYNTQQMAPLMALVQSIRENGQRLGGVSELMVGEGRQDAPVGTTLAMIDQATKVLNSVHKRMHSAQAEEFKLLVECFREHPESMIGKCWASQQWTEQTFIKALKDCDLVPQADPNTASHTQRVMKVQALNMWAQANPNLADPIEVAQVSLQAMGWNNPQRFLLPPSAMGQPTPEMQEIQAGIQSADKIANAKVQDAQAKTTIANARADEVKAKAMQGAYAPKGLAGAEKQPEGPNQLDEIEAHAKMMDAQTRRADLGIKAHQIQADTHNQALDRQAEAHSDLIDLAKEAMHDPQAAQQGAKETPKIEKEIGS